MVDTEIVMGIPKERQTLFCCPKVQCQIYHKIGHDASACYQRHIIGPRPTWSWPNQWPNIPSCGMWAHPPSGHTRIELGFPCGLKPQVLLTNVDHSNAFSQPPSLWYPDFDATHHTKYSLERSKVYRFLPLAHLAFLHPIIHIITKNLISVGQFARDNSIYLNFIQLFVAKMQGTLGKDGLYFSNFFSSPPVIGSSYFPPCINPIDCNIGCNSSLSNTI
ncbi:hypothetical protein CR513_54660, partial [Mucuna pruriens]